MKYIRSISVLSPQSPPRTYGLGAWFYVFLLISLVLLHFATALHMGPLFDCSRLTQNKICSLDDDIPCDRSVTKDLGKFTQFKAKVKCFYLVQTPLPLYLCEATLVKMCCHRKCFGSDSKSITKTNIKISAEECKQAVFNKTSTMGPLMHITNAYFATHTQDHFSCSWLKTKENAFRHLYFRGYSHYQVQKD